MIGVAGFGRRITWNEDKVVPPGYTMTFKDALYEASHRLPWRVIFPEWMLRWGTPTMRKFMRANVELEMRRDIFRVCSRLMSGRLAEVTVCFELIEVPQGND